jgi:hypothetical protein
MSFLDNKTDVNGNTYPWKCDGCKPKNDKHQPNSYGDPCPYEDKPLLTAKEDPKNTMAVFPAFCKKCGCTYTNGCPEHSSTDQKRLAT